MRTLRPGRRRRRKRLSAALETQRESSGRWPRRVCPADNRKVAFRCDLIVWAAAEALLATYSARANMYDGAISYDEGEVTGTNTGPLRSQQGRGVGLRSPTKEDGSRTAHAMQWKCQLEKRASRGTQAAETCVLVDMAD